MEQNIYNPNDSANSALGVEVLVSGVPLRLTYALPSELRHVGAGYEVSVEVGTRISRGWVIRRAPLSALSIPQKPSTTAAQLSLIEPGQIAHLVSYKEVLSATESFNPDQLPLFEWIASYYGVPLVEVLDTAIPSPTKKFKEVSLPQPVFGSAKPEKLTTGQESALGRITRSLQNRSFFTELLFGVTGSGKTEVYIRAIEQVLESGGSALVIVPEISLTPQLIDRFRTRLKEQIGLLHSEISAGLRWKTWQAILRGDTRVVIGARSAIFAPLCNLRLIIVDEEHESSYKHSDSARYHARDLAVVRGKLQGATVVLGSATPSFESLLNAMRKRYNLIEMPERATERPVPQIETVDLTKIKRKEMISPNISPVLYEAIRSALDKKEQVIILYNRRGFSTYLQCDSCGETVHCQNCSVALTYHKAEKNLLCHYCGISRPAPTHCRFCRDPRTTRVATNSAGSPIETESTIEEVGLLAHRGGGTERVVDELHALFPEAEIARMDRDTVTKKESYRDILGSMRSGKADILVGTQMIAKGHDLPGVTLVGIVDADVGLHMPDFRSSERAFQLITQAAGRAGRGAEPGRVIVQTREPDHPTIVATVTGKFRAFVRYELEQRKGLDYPPWGRLLRLIISSPDSALAYVKSGEVMEAVRKFAQEIVSQATSLDDAGSSVPLKISVLGPAPAPHEKLRGRYRFHLLVKANSAKVISQIAQKMYGHKFEIEPTEDVRLTIDVDPVEML